MSKRLPAEPAMLLSPSSFRFRLDRCLLDICHVAGALDRYIVGFKEISCKLHSPEGGECWVCGTPLSG